MSLGITQISLIVGNEFSLSIPVEGLNISLFRTEFNLLTNNVDENRPFYKTQTFEIPIEGNENTIAAIRAGKTDVKLFINNVLVLSGFILEYNPNDQTKTININIVSAFKEIVDFLGNNALFLDVLNYDDNNFYIPATFAAPAPNSLLRWARYLPINKKTGLITYNATNVAQYCEPSINLLTFFERCFTLNGWSANWNFFNKTADGGNTNPPSAVCLIPTLSYYCTSFEVRTNLTTVTVPPNSVFRVPFSTARVNVGGTSCNLDTVNKTVQVLAPARLQKFKLFGNYTADAPFSFRLTDGTVDLIQTDLLIGTGTVRQYSELIDPNLEGLDPLFLEIENPNPTALHISLSGIRFYNLFTIFANNQYDEISPVGYYYNLQDNYPDVTPLALFRQFLTLFQVAFSADDDNKTINFYYINTIPTKEFGYTDLAPRVLYDGYISFGAQLEGLGKINAIKYSGEDSTRRQSTFLINLTNLPSNSKYFESIFLNSADDNSWGAMVVPKTEYKVKQVGTISIEYLESKEIGSMIGMEKNNGDATSSLIFTPLMMPTLVRNYWSNILPFLTTANGKNPTMYELRLQAYLYEYINILNQRSLFTFKEDAIMTSGEYNPLTLEFRGMFLSLK